MALERELKFSLLEPPPPAEELMAAVAGSPFALTSLGTHVQRDRYLDDGAGTLQRAGLALRLRRSGASESVALKRLGSVRGAAHERDELEAPSPGAGRWPDTLVAALAESVGGDVLERLAPVVELETERTSYAVASGGRRIALLVFDDVTARRPGGGSTAHFREAEVEAAADVPLEPLHALAEVLQGVVALTPSSVTKLQRAEAVLALGDVLVPEGG
jgi:triphosphatase